MQLLVNMLVALDYKRELSTAIYLWMTYLHVVLLGMVRGPLVLEISQNKLTWLKR